MKENGDKTKQGFKEVSDIQGIVNILFDSGKEVKLSSLTAIK
jgi:hypothetical protein